MDYSVFCLGFVCFLLLFVWRRTFSLISFALVTRSRPWESDVIELGGESWGAEWLDAPAGISI